jgi:hypothetical protein
MPPLSIADEALIAIHHANFHQIISGSQCGAFRNKHPTLFSARATHPPHQIVREFEVKAIWAIWGQVAQPPSESLFAAVVPVSQCLRFGVQTK